MRKEELLQGRTFENSNSSYTGVKVSKNCIGRNVLGNGESVKNHIDTMIFHTAICAAGSTK